MPAVIRVVSGSGNGREYWIERPVLRIGSHPDSDFCLPNPSLSPHALTIEFRNKQYIVHNRGEHAFFIGKRSVEKQSKAVWSNGEQLEFPGVSALTLFVDKDPSPSAKPAASELETYPPEAPENKILEDEAPQAAKSSGLTLKEIIQLAVTIGCVLGIVAIIAFKMMPQKSDDAPKISVTLKQVLEDSKKTTDQDYHDMVREVQQACILKSKGDNVNATEKFTRVRAQLHNRRDEQGNLTQDYEKRLYSFIASKMSEK